MKEMAWSVATRTFNMSAINVGALRCRGPLTVGIGCASVTTTSLWRSSSSSLRSKPLATWVSLPTLVWSKLLKRTRLQQLWDLALQAKRHSLDAVELVVCELEDDPNFNADKGSVLATNGGVEMEAYIRMETWRSVGAIVGKVVAVGATNECATIDCESACSGGCAAKPKDPYDFV